MAGSVARHGLTDLPEVQRRTDRLTRMFQARQETLLHLEHPADGLVSGHWAVVAELVRRRLGI